jgi:glyoxylase-like metal-dependent hydrolase (beta-lactamase superfamily II)/ferredoxin
LVEENHALGCGKTQRDTCQRAEKVTPNEQNVLAICLSPSIPQQLLRKGDEAMADVRKQVSQNSPGEFFVDTTCIDCDTCRQLATSVFGETGKYSYVYAQPQSDDDRRRALQALVSCPTGSIGHVGTSSAKEVMGDFPLLVEEPVYYCGFTSPKSYGGSSYFVVHEAGNWLIDAPKFLPQLVKQFEAHGGVANIFLTHRDDVADADRYAQHFGSRRFIHQDELKSQPDAEVVFAGHEPIELAPGFVAIPTPGHTRGHTCLLFNNRILFTGDHLDWDRDLHCLAASEDYCWYSWAEQTESMARLAEFQFEWVLPGHGQRVHLPAEELRREILRLVERMRG